MEGQEMSMGEPNPAAMDEAAKETVHASAWGTALGEQAPTGVSPPQRASAPADGQNCLPRRYALQRGGAAYASGGERPGEGSCNRHKVN